MKSFASSLIRDHDVLRRQQRLPARLHNSIVTVSKLAIKAPIMANGKPPPQFPATRGEFEHLTSCVFSVFLLCFLRQAHMLPYTFPFVRSCRNLSGHSTRAPPPPNIPITHWMLSYFCAIAITESYLLISFVEERYEALMKSYNIPIAGDTAAKREAIRSFIGLPQN